MSQADMLSINAVAAKLGLSVHQLRRWELMFGLEIKRGRGQQRQYRSEDMSVLERIKELVEQGWPTSQIRPQLEAEGLVTPKLIGLPPPPGNPEVLSEALIGFRNFTERRFIEISRQIDELRQLLISITLKQELQGETSSPWQPVQREFAPEPKPMPAQEFNIGPDYSAAPPVEFTPPPPPPQRTSIIGAPATPPEPPKESTFEVGPSFGSFSGSGSGSASSSSASAPPAVPQSGGTPVAPPERRSIIGEPSQSSLASPTIFPSASTAAAAPSSPTIPPVTSSAPPSLPTAPELSASSASAMTEEEADALLEQEDLDEEDLDEAETTSETIPAASDSILNSSVNAPTSPAASSSTSSADAPVGTTDTTAEKPKSFLDEVLDNEEEHDDLLLPPAAPTITPVSSAGESGSSSGSSYGLGGTTSGTSSSSTSGSFAPASSDAGSPKPPMPPVDPFKSSPFSSSSGSTASAPAGFPSSASADSSAPVPPVPPAPPEPSTSSFAPSSAALTPSSASDMFSSVIQSVNDAAGREPAPPPPAPTPPEPEMPGFLSGSGAPAPGPGGTPFTPPGAEAPAAPISSPFSSTPAAPTSSPFSTPPPAPYMSGPAPSSPSQAFEPPVPPEPETAPPAPPAPPEAPKAASAAAQKGPFLGEITDQNYLTILGRALDLVGWSDEQADSFSVSRFKVPHWDELGRSQAEVLIEHLLTELQSQMGSDS